MKKKIGIGIAGFGNMGKTHAFAAENLKYFYNCDFDPRVVGLCASSHESAQEYAERYSLGRAFESFDELICSDEVDVVDICTPNIYHFEQIKKALDAGKHVYCEKPLCVTYEEAAVASQMADKSGVTAGVVFNTRFLLPVMRAKELIDQGAIGKILSFDIKFLHSSAMDTSRTGWKQDRTICGGGVLFDLGSHAIDLTRYLCGEFSRLRGKSQIAFPKRMSRSGEPEWQTNADEAFYIQATLANGAEGNVNVGKIYSGTNDDFSFEIYGTHGHVRFNLMEPNWLYFYSADAPEAYRGVTRIECVGRYPEPASSFPGMKAPVGWLRGHIGSMYNFLSCVHHHKTPSPSFKDACEVQKVLDAAYISDMSGGYVDV